MTIQTDTEIPLYFGDDKTLFGIYHPARSAAGQAALLCPPLGQDQIRCHRLYRQLANGLAAAGIPVLRFDYRGTGDSAGDGLDVEWLQCVGDTVVAANELRTLAGCDRIVAIGARLGASLALAAAATARFTRLVLWDPILDGASHVAQLDRLQAGLPLDKMRFIERRSAADATGQWLGFQVSDRFRQQLIELRPDPVAAATLILDSSASLAAHDRDRFVAAGATVKALQNPTAWDDLDRIELAIVSHELVQSISLSLKEAP